MRESPFQRDALARRIQFAFGACFGVGMGFVLAWRWEVRATAPFLLLLGATAVVAGLAAARWGDRFWHWLAGNHGRW